MGKRVVIFGPPGVGKGTHSKRLAADLGVPHVATGELFRDAMSQRTDVGQRAETYIRRGELLPDDMVVAMMNERLSRGDAQQGFLLDGFPRTIPQAQALQGAHAATFNPAGVVLSLQAPDELLVKRIAGRFTCRGCHSVFNRFFQPSQRDGVCDKCGSPLEQRTDDHETAVRRRLIEYQAKTKPVLDFLSVNGWTLRPVSTVGPVEDVYRDLWNATQVPQTTTKGQGAQA